MHPLDQATVRLLRATSSPAAARRADDEEHRGAPAYDAPGHLVRGWPVCGAADCFAQFRPEPSTHQRFCSARCRLRETYRRRGGGRRRRGVVHRGRRAAVAGAVLARRQREVA